MRGIGGKDIADGTPKLVLALLWQLMRAHGLKLLGELGVTEADILAWANRRVAAAGKVAQRIETFSDPSLQSGVFLLELLAAVGPECAAAERILAGDSADEQRLNATLAISWAHKMGCTVFATWEDLVRGRNARFHEPRTHKLRLLHLFGRFP